MSQRSRKHSEEVWYVFFPFLCFNLPFELSCCIASKINIVLKFSKYSFCGFFYVISIGSDFHSSIALYKTVLLFSLILAMGNKQCPVWENVYLYLR